MYIQYQAREAEYYAMLGFNPHILTETPRQLASFARKKRRDAMRALFQLIDINAGRQPGDYADV